MRLSPSTDRIEGKVMAKKKKKKRQEQPQSSAPAFQPIMEALFWY